MNSIDTILTKSSSPTEACRALYDYMQINIYESPISKQEEFYSKIPDILDKLLGTSSYSGWIDIIPKKDQAIIFDLFDPSVDRMRTNLFKTMVLPRETLFFIRVPINIFSEQTQNLIKNKQYGGLSSFFHNLTDLPENQSAWMDKNCVSLSPAEYFFIRFLQAIKNNIRRKEFSILKYDTAKLYEFPLLPGNVIPKIYSENRLFSIFTWFLPTLAMMKKTANSTFFDLFIRCIEEIWLVDIFNMDKVLPARTEKSLIGFYQSNARSASYQTNPLILECLYAAFYFINRNYAPNMGIRKSNINFDQFNRNAEISAVDLLQNSFYLFMKIQLRNINNQGSFSRNSELYFENLCTLWFYYIQPWQDDEILNQLFNHREYPDEDIGSPTLSPLGKLGSPYSKKYTMQSQPENMRVWTPYIYSNILFYTDIFAEILKGFRQKRSFNENDINFLISVKELYSYGKNSLDENYDSILNEIIPFSLLSQLSAGKIMNIPYAEKISIALNKSQVIANRIIDPFNARDMKLVVQSIIKRLSPKNSWISTKNTEFSSKTQDLITKFCEMFRIDPKSDLEAEKSAKKEKIDKNFDSIGTPIPQGIIPIKDENRLARKSYNWDDKTAYFESYILLCTVYYIAVFLEKYIKLSKVKYNYQLKRYDPLGFTWLRALAHKGNALILSVLCLILYLVIKFLI